jgi:hypothetical protein
MHQRQRDAEQHPERQAAEDLAEGDQRVPAEIGAVDPQSARRPPRGR